MTGMLLLQSDKKFTFVPDHDRTDTAGGKFIIKRKGLPVFPSGAVVNCIVHYKKGDRLSYLSRIEMSTDFQLNVYVELDSEKELEDRRRFYKIYTALPCEVINVQRGDDVLDFDPGFNSVVRNINLGGVFFFLGSNLVAFRVGDLVTLHIPDIMGKKMDLLMKILRVQFRPDGEISGYGCSFISIDPVHEGIIAQYINKLQIDKLAEEKEREALLLVGDTNI
ncbi:hypothetical protein FACS189499_10320 [Clostridia bacterium]|nr:hypothetical protein FACS189499_10320 [Clostridia bacterium]